MQIEVCALQSRQACCIGQQPGSTFKSSSTVPYDWGLQRAQTLVVDRCMICLAVDALSRKLWRCNINIVLRMRERSLDQGIFAKYKDSEAGHRSDFFSW